ncbi:MAG: Bax inhibitor-1/YccA family protein [Candidatus Phytoplasma stylosanthis]|nr:Bax inhibitor-1/YccA family protein [Candidatus Phytoplasma stylosanthis]
MSFFKQNSKNIKNNPIIENIKSTVTKEYGIMYNSDIIFQTSKLSSIGLKTAFLFLCTFISSLLSGILFCKFPIQILIENHYMLLLVITLIQLILLFRLSFLSFKGSIEKQKNLVIAYALIEGISVGIYIAILKMAGYKNIFESVMISSLTTFILFMITHFLYSTNLIKLNKKLYLFALSSIITLFFINLGISILKRYTDITISTPLLIFVALFSLLIGCIFLAIDFHDAEFLVENRLPKEYEWNAALGFHITLIFIFFQVMRLLRYFGFLKREN